jgi:hypothetical protein
VILSCLNVKWACDIFKERLKTGLMLELAVYS